MRGWPSCVCLCCRRGGGIHKRKGPGEGGREGVGGCSEPDGGGGPRPNCPCVGGETRVGGGPGEGGNILLPELGGILGAHLC